MKKIILLITIIWTATWIQAQNDVIFGNEKPTERQNGTAKESNVFTPAQEGFAYHDGSTTLEVGFNPGNVFGSSQGDMFGLINGYIKFRQFSASDRAFRMGVNLTYLSYSDIIQQADSDADLKELRAKTRLMGLGLMLGTEKHYLVNRRISPYTGWQGEIQYLSSKFVQEYQSGTDVETVTYYNDPAVTAEGYFKLGVSFISGIDYYFMPHFYIGVELGIGISYSKILTTRVEYSEDSDLDEEFKHGHRILLTPHLTTGNLRLGWSF